MTSANLEILNTTNETDCVDEISRLHHEIFQQAETMLQNIMRVGELLVQQKQKLPHGQFAKWIEENLPFTTRTAQNYMRVFRNKEQLKNENVSVLSDAYNILKLKRDPITAAGDEDEKRYFITISVHREHRELFKDVLDIAKELLNTNSNSAAIMYIMYNWGISAMPDQMEI